MNKIEPRLLKGFRDYGPAEQSARQAMFASIQSSFERFGFSPMSTPVLEYKEILVGKIGEDEKLIYSFKDNGDRDVAMRYDLTVPLARYIAQNQGALTLPFKRYQIAPVWRADNPQKGRLREFYQCDVDIIGADSALADAEVIACVCKAIESVGITNFTVRLNDRRVFTEFTNGLAVDQSQVTEIIRAIDKVNKIGKEGVINILREKQIPQSAIDKVERFLSFGDDEAAMFAEISPEVGDALKTLRSLVLGMGVAPERIVLDPTIARGLNYYTSTVFETVLPDKPEFGSICSGGRYDKLVDQFSNTPVSAVGGSIGIDRLFDAMNDMGIAPAMSAAKVLVLNIDEQLQEAYVTLATELREAGIATELYYTSAAKLEKQFKYAESKNIPFALIMGQTEQEKGVVQLKDLTAREQQEVPLKEIVSRLQ